MATFEIHENSARFEAHENRIRTALRNLDAAVKAAEKQGFAVNAAYDNTSSETRFGGRCMRFALSRVVDLIAEDKKGNVG